MTGDLLTQSAELFPSIVTLRRALHRHPEISFKEFETQKTLAQALAGYAIGSVTPIAKTGLLAKVAPSDPDKAAKPPVIIRADIDALPIQEQTGLSFSSQNQGIMHACGHDLHMSCLTGALALLQQQRDNLPCPVYGLFQPAEEQNPGGAKGIVESGILQALGPKAIFAQHVHPELPSGAIGFRPGLMMAAEDEIQITVIGKGGHGGAPHSSIDAVLIACHLVTALQQIISRQIPAGIPSVLSFGSFQANGAHNILPDQVHIKGTFRITDEKWREFGLARIEELTKQLCSSMGGSAKLHFERGYPAVINDAQLCQKLQSSAENFGGFSQIVELPLVMWAEDFAYYSRVAPAVMYNLGVAGPKGSSGLHTATFLPHEEALIAGMAYMAQAAIDIGRAD